MTKSKMPQFKARVMILEQSFITLEIFAYDKESAKAILTEMTTDIFNDKSIKILTNDPDGYEVEEIVSIELFDD